MDASPGRNGSYFVVLSGAKPDLLLREPLRVRVPRGCEARGDPGCPTGKHKTIFRPWKWQKSPPNYAVAGALDCFSPLKPLGEEGVPDRASKPPSPVKNPPVLYPHPDSLWSS